MCKDIRLQRDPSIPVVKENAASTASQHTAETELPKVHEDVPDEHLAEGPVVPVGQSVEAQFVTSAVSSEDVPDERLAGGSVVPAVHSVGAQFVPSLPEEDSVTMETEDSLAEDPAVSQASQASRVRLSGTPVVCERSTMTPIKTMIFTSSAFKTQFSQTVDKPATVTKPDAKPETAKTPETKSKPFRKVELIEGPASKKLKMTVTLPPPPEVKSTCPFPTCPSVDKKLRRHMYQHHFPFLFGRKEQTEEIFRARLESLKSLIRASVGPNASLDDAIKVVNDSKTIPKDSQINVEHQGVFHAMCRALKWEDPESFTVIPVSSPAALTHWRCLVALLLRLPYAKQRQWCLKEFIEEDIEEQPVVPATRQIMVTIPELIQEELSPERPPDRRHLYTIEEESEISEEEILEEFVVMDECSDSSDVNQNTETIDCNAYDSHFHLDRTGHKLCGRQDLTMEEMLNYPMPEQPALAIQLVGVVIVYSEPTSYPKNLVCGGKWRLALGVHPKHVDELTSDRFLELQQLVKDPAVAAIGEIGLDRTVPVKFWRKQDVTFRRVLQLARPAQPIILHLRGPDRNGADVHARALQIINRICQSSQKIHVHCFTGDSEMVKEWREHFPNAYFGFTANVKGFSKEQIQALQSIPMERILLETDSPYMPPGGKGTNTPNFIGDVASLVAEKLEIPVPKLLAVTLKNGQDLYGQ